MLNDISKHLNVRHDIPLRVVFSTIFSVFGYPDETLSLVFDILQNELFGISVLHNWVRFALICSHNFITEHQVSLLTALLLSSVEASLSSKSLRLRKRKRAAETANEDSGHASTSCSVHKDLGEPVRKSKRCLLNSGAETPASTSKATIAPALLAEGPEAAAPKTVVNDVSVFAAFTSTSSNHWSLWIVLVDAVGSDVNKMKLLITWESDLYGKSQTDRSVNTRFEIFP